MKNRKRVIKESLPEMKVSEVRRNSEHNRDINSKTIFDNAILCAQFLRDNIDVPMLKNVQPDDIEDVSERYRPYLGTEYESDAVKRIRIIDNETECESVFLISLVEHKSLVDYDVSMQLLKYMMCIWIDYGKEMEEIKEGITRRKSFRYPMIIPIVYYEGKAEWTADVHLKERISGGNFLDKFIPDFQYEVVRVHNYSNEELLARGDEMSLIMLINKIQDAGDLAIFNQLPRHDVERIIKDSPGSIIDILISVIENLCTKIGATEEETKQCVRKVRERKMGYLFENMEKMNIQEERRNTAEAVHKLEEATQKLDETIHRLDETTQKLNETEKKAYEIAEKGIRTLIEVCQEMGMSRKETCIKVMEKFKSELTGTEIKTEVEIKKIAEEKINNYWK